MDLTQMPVRDRIRDCVCGFLGCDGRAASLRDEDDLMEVLDSLQFLRLVGDLEGMFAIRIGNDELTPENFGSVESLTAFVGRKRP